ncbi:MAG: hypothetical protein COV59_04955 [Candidatus Magasanikbacteria bacterium CG11_big_fil_rev_8_21_14_0_20_39_34]|uniref:Uncharacterized protein n=1 Tax=Candidatus Magasanikbacteria bacterium CG11_big_fil_rev_8_21_14_0_20_39_34 TaxID=1974653 RepID=A0A2H0N3N7_9BACT|nr:MAG: hypothetical protein COV59_04955 [Candidatus Magasanikbacteria bacterium CG11_big_fil_rev_8_21_14_0_20_39_34]
MFFIDFTCGGHDFVYHFVPSGEVWIDNDIMPKGQKFVLLHELHERRRMAEGWGYPKAHYESSKIEYHCRHFPSELDLHLRQEHKINGNITA